MWNLQLLGTLDHLINLLYRSNTADRLTMANHMLSLVGSLQLDPFSPRHALSTASPTLSQAEEEAAVLNELEVEVSDSESSDADSQLDPFAQLGKIADKSKKAEKRAREDTAKKEEPKKKRKAVEKDSGKDKVKKMKRKKS